MENEQLNEANAEAVSRRTSATMRGIIIGAAAVLLLFGCWSASVLSSKSASSGEETTALGMTWYIASITALIGIVALGGVFVKMDRGIRQQNLRAIGIVLVAILITLLAIAYGDGFEAVLGLLGAIVGYLFGKDSSSNDGDDRADRRGNGGGGNGNGVGSGEGDGSGSPTPRTPETATTSGTHLNTGASE